jgi:hypothetical protein
MAVPRCLKRQCAKRDQEGEQEEEMGSHHAL